MPKLPSTYTVEAFLDNNRNRIWRIEWFGEVDLNPLVPSEPTIEVVLVPLWRSEIDPQMLNKKGAYEHSARRIVRVGVGLLPCLHIGTLWRGGRQLDTPPYTLRRFARLLITPGTSRVTDALHDPDLITADAYPSVAGCVKAKYLVVDLDRELHEVNKLSKLIIPCVEVGRSYYTNSTQLTRAMIGGGLHTHANGVYAPHKTRQPDADGVAFVQLRDTIKDADRYIVGRCALDPVAGRNAGNIYTSIIRNASLEQCAVLEARPPFEGLTDLKVQGKWIRSADEVWHFLAYRIVSCTAPFPFGQIDWARDNDGTPAGDRDPARPVAYPGAAKRPVCPKEREEGDRLITNAEEPSLDYEVTDIELDDERFPDLHNKRKGKKHRNTENHTRAGDVRPGGPQDADTFSTGAGGHDQSAVAPVSVTHPEGGQGDGAEEDSRDTRLPAGLNNFKAILRELEGLADITTSLVLLDPADESTEVRSCTYFPVLYGHRPLTWSYIDFEARQRRQAMIAHCYDKGAHFYILDIEVREEDENDRYSMLLLHGTGLGEVSEGHLRAVLHFAAQERGRWTHEWEWRNLAKERFKHDLGDAAKYAQRFITAMHRIVEGADATAKGNISVTVCEQQVSSSDDLLEKTANTSVAA